MAAGITAPRARDIASATGAPAGLAAGTRVMTARGEIAVEDLAPGDRIVTRDAGMRPLLALRINRIAGLRPCRIARGALGHDRPGTDVTLAPGQPVLLRDWRARALYGAEAATVAVERLVDGGHIARPTCPGELDVVELVFDAPHIVYAEGLELAAATGA